MSVGVKLREKNQGAAQRNRMRSTQTQQRRNAYAIATIYYNIKREGRGYNIDLVGTAQRLKGKGKEREIFRDLYLGETRNGNFGCTHREKEGEALDSTSSRPSRRCLCRLAFSIRSSLSLSLSSDLIPLLSDLGLGFRFVFSQFDSVFVCFSKISFD